MSNEVRTMCSDSHPNLCPVHEGIALALTELGLPAESYSWPSNIVIRVDVQTEGWQRRVVYAAAVSEDGELVVGNCFGKVLKQFILADPQCLEKVAVFLKKSPKAPQSGPWWARLKMLDGKDRNNNKVVWPIHRAMTDPRFGKSRQHAK